MSRPLPGAAVLAAALAPSRAQALLSRHPGADPAGVGDLLALPGDGRLAALAAFVERSAADVPPEPAARSAEETRVRVPVASEPSGAGDRPGDAPEWPVLGQGGVLPFDLAPSAPALAQVDAGLLELGARVARIAASGIASVVGGEASVDGRLLPGVTAPAGAALVPVDLTAIAGVATLAVERSFAARLAARVADAPPPPGLPPALAPAERAVVELAVLGALEAIAAETGVEPALAPRLALRGGAPLRPLCVELTVVAAGVRGRAILALPEAALRALRGPPSLPPSLAGLPVPASVALAEASLRPEDAAALAPGDVLLLDAPGEEAALRLRGEVVARGRVEGEALHVAEVEGAGDDGTLPAVPVVVELAGVSLPLAELARVAPGAVLPLGIDRSGRVTLRIGDRAVAHGELVEADGAVGVRILAPGDSA